MKLWQWALLMFELCLFAIILVLPQVDLPDFTFHGSTAPIVAKSRVSPGPPPSVTPPPLQSPLSQPSRETKLQRTKFALPLIPRALLLLFCALLC